MTRASMIGALFLGMASLSGAASSFDGRYVLDKVRSADVGKAIEEATASMNFASRHIARSRLAKTNISPADVSLSVTDRVEIGMGAKPVSVLPDGKAVSWTRPDGEVFQVSVRLEGDRLVETFQGKDGSRRNTFALLDGGQAVAMDVLVESTRLPQPVSYRLVFRRSLQSP